MVQHSAQSIVPEERVAPLADRDLARPSGDQAIRLAIDVGGTFTDIAILHETEGVVRFDKVETTPTDPAVGVMNGVVKVDAAIADVSYFVHGTTLALNALLTRGGARVCLVTTKGFRDVYLLGRTDRDETYNLKYQRPEGLIPRDLIFEVGERMDFEGQTVTPFDRQEALQVAKAIEDAAIHSVAVCFLHSYANPAHELLMEEVLAEACPGVEVTLSHRLLREYREYERTSTAVIDAYVKPVVRKYLDHLRSSLLQGGFSGRFLVTRSGGGAMTVETAIEQPAYLVLSGPAAGVTGAAALSSTIGEPNLKTNDMGGTSLDASLIFGGVPTTISEAHFQGQPISLSSLNIKTLGAGGGSIAWIDEAGHIHVGPKSAGALPGPASYGRGGTQATVTDAALLVGYLGAQTALGGELLLSRPHAEEAIGRLGRVLSMTSLAVAEGIMRIVTTNITGAVREITVERGYSPADFALLAYGGAGGLVASAVARELRIPRVIIPPGPGAFCALGMLLTDVAHDFAQTKVGELARMTPSNLNGIFAELETRAGQALEADGFATADTVLTRSADLRFHGQEHAVEVPVPWGTLTDEAIAATAALFATMHQDRYGHRMEDPVELVTARLRGTGKVPRPELPLAGEGNPSRAHIGSRDVLLNAGNATARYEVYRREHLGRGRVIEGPTIVEEHTATTVLHRGDVLVVGDHGELRITIGGEHAGQ